jgi:hypothetical protein
MDTVKELIDNSFREFNVVSSLYRDCDRFFQKRIRDTDSGYVYDFKKYDIRNGQISTTVEVDFYTDKDQNIRISITVS